MKIQCARCVSVLRYLTDHISALGLGVLARLVTTHDTPGLVAAAIQSQPWTRESGAGPQVTRRPGEQGNILTLLLPGVERRDVAQERREPDRGEDGVRDVDLPVQPPVLQGGHSTMVT